MPAPTNISFATATDLGTSLPVTVTQQVDFSGTTYTVYYSYTAQAGDHMLGVFAFGDLTVYKPSITVYTGPAGSPTLYMTGLSAQNKAIQFPVTVSTQYFFQITTNGGNPSPANLTLNVQTFTASSIPAGSIGVNDDTFVSGGPQFPIAVLDGTTGAPIAYVTANPTEGEWAAIWTDGTLALTGENEDDPTVARIYDSAIALLTTVSDPIGGSTALASLTSDMSSRFYVSGSGSTTVKAFNQNGTIVGTWTTAAAPFNLGVTQDNATLYFTSVAGGSAVHQHDLNTDTPLPDLVATLANYTLGKMPILVLSDGTVIVGYVHTGTAPQDVTIKSFTSGGVLVQTYAIGTVGADPRIAMALDDPNSFWVWTKGSGATLGVSTFQNIKVSDGSVLASFTAREYEAGVYRGTTTATPDARFGHSESCSFWMSRTTSSGSIVVMKTGIPSSDTTTFHFSAGGGLSPASFTLTPGSSQTFSGLAPGSGYSVSEAPNADYTTTSAASNGTIEAITVTAGATTTVTFTNRRISPSYAVNSRVIRRLRRAPHIAALGNRIFIKRFLLDMQTGVGAVTGLGQTPIVMLRYSHDGGQTWSDEIEMSAGELGHYLTRVQAYALGQARDWVFEVTVSDPVSWSLMASALWLEEGLS